MSTLGGRLGLAALQYLAPGSEAVRGTFGVRTCALDGIAEATGCREEDGTMRVLHDGRHALTLEVPGRSITVGLPEATLCRAATYRDLCNELEAGWESLLADEQQKRRAVMDQTLDRLLPQFWNLPDTTLLTIEGGSDRV
ncbi:MAG: hypothetical protein C0616_07350 [Desulfuromonas sp.]|nr:MAG: hypothetical protein C0616_07350 [Desulfuromonas sp.]